MFALTQKKDNMGELMGYHF